MEPEPQIPGYRVRVKDQNGLSHDAYLEPADKIDMIGSRNFDWLGFWDKADFYCEAFIKLSFGSRVLGLIRFALYPAHTDCDFEYLEILHLEAVHRNQRAANPVGFWLIWYGCHIALMCCPGEEDGTLIRLDSTEGAIEYYENKVSMYPLGWVTSAPGEDLYAFRFTTQEAERFCRRQEHAYGKPVKLS